MRASSDGSSRVSIACGFADLERDWRSALARLRHASVRPPSSWRKDDRLHESWRAKGTPPIAAAHFAGAPTPRPLLFCFSERFCLAEGRVYGIVIPSTNTRMRGDDGR